MSWSGYKSAVECRRLCSSFLSVKCRRISMDKGVHPRFACQLETRTWYITDDTGDVETVNGPGVVGKYYRPCYCFFADR